MIDNAIINRFGALARFCVRKTSAKVPKSVAWFC